MNTATTDPRTIWMICSGKCKHSQSLVPLNAGHRAAWEAQRFQEDSTYRLRLARGFIYLFIYMMNASNLSNPAISNKHN